MISKEVLEMQAPSTRRALERPESEDIEWLNRKIPLNAQVRDEAGNVFLNERRISYQEASVYYSLRSKCGERIAEIRKEMDVASVNVEKKIKAIDAFMGIFSPEVIKAKFKDLMKDLKTEGYAEMIARGMRKLRDE